MMKTGISKVKDVQGAGQFTNDFGTFNTFEYEFEDGTVMKANHKNGSFHVGDEIEYEIKREHKEFGSSGSVKKPQEVYQQNTNGTPQVNGHKQISQSDDILYSVCLKGAMDYLTSTYNPQFEMEFDGKTVNDLALDIAKKAKEYKQKL